MLVEYRDFRIPNGFRSRHTRRLRFPFTTCVITSTIQEHPGQMALT
jgi:hypothetical protein